MADDTTTGAGAEQMKQAADQAQRGFEQGFADPARRAGEAMQQSGQKMAEGGSAIGLRMIEQAEENTQQAFAAMRAAAQAKDLSDVMRIQGDFLREQGSRSMAQAREIGEMIVQFGRDVVTPIKDAQG
ncbi:hypothetical protein GCM10011380_05080 [Sphingomonas metalli]|jgi:hypothetical protein|uniref:Phasin domain-containing protein n=1 Tax=Sphingomonas metalli TaxID=1779358 RepID=A0A916SVQ1_9SPHN|nr:phasin family protein [Sphingomonas metalli]GGB18485.1 hypothetical protein GCM10011380_05080 [Sphingomonas metalli]